MTFKELSRINFTVKYISCNSLRNQQICPLC